MRSSMYKLSQYGGTILKPLFTIDKNDGFGPNGFNGVIDPQDVSSILWGSAVKADLVFNQFTYTKQVKFPAGTKWIDLNTMDPIIAQSD